MKSYLVNIKRVIVFLLHLLLALSILGQEKNIQTLPPNQTLKNILKSGEMNSYEVTLKAGEYFHLIVEQKGIDVVLSVISPDGKVLVERDRPNGTSGQESLSFIVTTGGKYRLEVKALSEVVQTGEYEIKGETRRTASEQDKKRIEAEKLFAEGTQLSRENAIEPVKQASTKFESAAQLWLVIGDKYAEALTQAQLGFNLERLLENEKATRAQERAFILYKELKDNKNAAIALLAVGRLSLSNGEFKKAIDNYNLALPLWRTIDDKIGEAESLRSIGTAYLESGEPKKAIDYYNQALPLWRKTISIGAEAETLCTLGRAYFYLGEHQKGIDYYIQALPLWRKINNGPEEAKNIYNIGYGYSLLGDKQKTLDYYNQALSITRRIKDMMGEAEILNGIGSLYFNFSEIPKALGYFEQALVVQRAIPNLRGEAETLSNFAHSYMSMGEIHKAVDYYNQALLLWKQITDKKQEAITLTHIGGAHFSLGENQKALNFFNQALSLNRNIQEALGEAFTLNGLGEFYFRLGENEKALDFFNQALSLWKVAGYKNGEVKTINFIGSVYAALGDNQKSLNYSKQALSILQEFPDIENEIITYNNIGTSYYELGEFKEAFDYLNLALSKSEESGKKLNEAMLTSHIGALYSKLSETKKAVEYYEKALELYKKLGITYNMHNTLISIGLLTKDNDKALEYFNRALVLAKTSKNKRAEASTLINIGKVYSSKGNKEKALDYFNQGLTLSQTVGDKDGEGRALHNMALDYADAGDKQKALNYYNRALLIWKITGDKYTEIATFNNIMTLWFERKDSQFSVFYGKEAVNSLQNIRSDIQKLTRDKMPESEPQRAFMNNFEPIYRHLAGFLIEQNRLVEAHQVLNALKDQQYFDLNPNSLKKPVPLTFNQREEMFNSQYMVTSNKISDIGGQLERLKRLIGNGTPSSEESASLQRLESELKVATDDFLAILKQAETEFNRTPDKTNDKELKIIDTHEMKNVLRDIGKNTVAVYTLAHLEKFYALIVTHDDIMAVSVPISAENLNIKAKQLWALLQSDEYDPKILSKEIYDLVFKPIKDKLIKEKKFEKVLPEGSTIIWSLDGNLRYLPMAALYDGEKYLVERYSNVVFTRAETSRWTQGVSPNWRGVGFGASQGGSFEHLGKLYPFDNLPNVDEELKVIFKTDESPSGIFLGNIFPDEKFTRQAMLDALKENRPLVHISSHFYFSPGDSERSFLLLGNKTLFPLNEMKKYTNLFQGVELLTLSACETAANWADSDGREVDGFAELAQRLGASAVMATLWKVRDDSSYWLMRDFYQRKQNPVKETKAESLRQAQISLLNGTAQVQSFSESKKSVLKRSSGNSTIIKILPNGLPYPTKSEDGIVYIEARYAKSYIQIKSKLYAHPYFWSPFILFGNWR